MMASKRSRTAFEGELQKQESPYAFYGSPLPPLDQYTRDDGSYVPVWKQEVVDDRGRKRLHGAFTGGFSAGYYNTVGSKEGWTPSTFVSSRQNRQKDARKGTQQRPEDFMDEEDIREAEEAKVLHTTDDFAGFGSTEAHTTRLDGLNDLFKYNGETVGSTLLKKMGWKEGQGIGPRIRKTALVDHEKVGPGGAYLVAPQDAAMISFSQKTDTHGLGYSADDGIGSVAGNLSNRTSVQQSLTGSDDEKDSGLFTSFSPRKNVEKRAAQKSGFGVGILNDTGSDDEDPYQMGPKISYNKTLGGAKKTKKKPSVSSSSNPLLRVKPLFVSKRVTALKTTSGFRKCHDGRLPLEGFVLAIESDSSLSSEFPNDRYKPPEVPMGWESSKATSSTLDAPQYLNTKEAAKASTLNAKLRGALLGEAQLPGKSVFDFLTPSARDRLAAASGNDSLPAALGEKVPDGYVIAEKEKARAEQELIPPVDPDVAMQALNRGLSGWMPYAEDEEKRSRYRAYLETRAGIRDSPYSRSPSVSKDDWAIEMQEFARTAQVFKPVTGIMASRFTSSTQSKVDYDNNNSSSPTDSPLSRPAAKPEDPAETAARLGMFGPMTRSIQKFYPTRLLCKRFNVRPPENEEGDPGHDHGKPSGATSRDHDHLRFSSQQLFPASLIEAGSSAATVQAILDLGEHGPRPTPDREDGNGPLVNIEKPVMVDADRNEALEADRPGQAVFKAIFGSDDEDD